jgi:type VI secretion system Hcp family effector
MKKVILLFTAILVQLFATALVVMEIQGVRQGIFKGEGSKNFPSKSEVLGLQTEVSVPTNPSTGMATGAAQMKTVYVLKLTGAASPQILNAIVDNEMLSTVKLEFYELSQMEGKLLLTYTITLKNAFITGFKQLRGTFTNEKFTAIDPKANYDQIAFSYQTMEVESKTGNIRSISRDR